MRWHASPSRLLPHPATLPELATASAAQLPATGDRDPPHATARPSAVQAPTRVTSRPSRRTAPAHGRRFAGQRPRHARQQTPRSAGRPVCQVLRQNHRRFGLARSPRQHSLPVCKAYRQISVGSTCTPPFKVLRQLVDTPCASIASPDRSACECRVSKASRSRPAWGCSPEAMRGVSQQLVHGQGVMAMPTQGFAGRGLGVAPARRGHFGP